MKFNIWEARLCSRGASLFQGLETLYIRIISASSEPIFTVLDMARCVQLLKTGGTSKSGPLFLPPTCNCGIRREGTEKERKTGELIDVRISNGTTYLLHGRSEA